MKLPSSHCVEEYRSYIFCQWRSNPKPFKILVYISGKGVGRIQIEPQKNLTVDIFVTHTIADSGTTLANNTWYRVKQAEELIEKYVKKSKADATILGKDIISRF